VPILKGEMPEQYVAKDQRSGLEVAVTGNFPEHPDDRVRIARTCTLFTRLISTLLIKDESERRYGFRAVETQLELADALIQQDMGEVRRLVRETMQTMGISDSHLEDLAQQLRDLGVDPGPLDPSAAGSPDEPASDAAPPIDISADDLPPGDRPGEDEPPAGPSGDKWGPDQEPPVVGGRG
jgi:hypothetical protein